MTRPIDEKIVAMKMDNSDFVKKASETTNIFGKLRDSLNKIPGVNLGKTAQDMSTINKEAVVGSGNFGKLNEQVQNIANRFSTLGIIGVTALQNITNRAIDAGLALGKSLTLDQITSGFREYELKIGSIGTVLANTEWAGTTLDDVKAVLEDLNNYADQTVYNFGQMTENIGRFTAAGVRIEDSATAIKGLSNLAAASGSNVQQLNSAMYQMSQSMAAGTMNLMDWNSLVNAGMAGKKTQDALIATAKEMGIVVDLTDGFRNSIQQGWLTSEVFLETMKKFGEDESMTKAATSVRTFTAMMDSLRESIGSGWAETWEYVFGDFEEATEFWTKASEGITGWFSKTAEARNELVKGIADQGGFLNIFEGIQNAVKPVIQVFEALGEGFSRVFPPKSVDQIVAMTETFKEFTAGLLMNGETIEKLTTIFQGAFSIFSTVFEILKQLGGALLRLIPPGLGGGILDVLEKVALMAIEFNQSVKDGNALTATIDGLGNVLSIVGGTISEVIGSIVDFSSSLTDNLGRAITWVMDKLAPVGEILRETFGEFGGDDLLGAGTLAAIISGVVLLATKIISLFDSFSDITESFSETLEGVADSVQAFAMGIKIANLVLIAGALTMIAVSLKMLEGISTEDITKGVTALAVALGVMMGGLAVISKFNLVGGMGASVTLIAIATSVTIMASALKKISDLNPDELKTGILGLVAITGTLAGALVAISKLGGPIRTSSLQLVALAGSVRILADAVSELSSIDEGNLKSSVMALGVIFAELAVFLKVVNGAKFGPGSALGLIGIAGSIQMMVSAINQISSIDTNGLIKGLTTIGVLLAEIAIFSQVSSGTGMLAAGPGILMIAGAINALVPPIQTLGSMTLEELAKGLTSMGVALAAVAGAGQLASGSIGGATAITVMAAALNLLLIPIQAFAQMTWGEILTGLGGLGATLGVVAGAALLLTPATPAMLAFGSALALVGVAVAATGAGIALFGTGLAALATLTAASIAAIVSALGLLLAGFADLIPATADFVVKMGLALIDGMGELVPPLIDTVINIIISLLGAISDNLPKFLELGGNIVIQLILGIGELVPKLVDAGFKAIISLIQGLSDAVRNNGPLLISTVLELLGEIILLVVEAGVQTIDALFGWIPGVKQATSAIGDSAEQYIRENFGAYEAGRDKGNEFNEGLTSTLASAGEAGESIAVSAQDGVSSVDMTPLGAQAGQDFADGLASKSVVVQNSASLLANTTNNTLRTDLDINSPSGVTTELGKYTGEGFANGIKSQKGATAKASTSVANSAKDAFKDAMDDAEYKFDMGQLNSEQYIAEIKKIKKAYSEYPELVKEANLEIKKIEEQAVKDREELLKKQFNKQKSLIDERKSYNELSLTQELAAWERMMNRYAEGTEQRKEAEREVYRLKNEINTQLTTLNDEYIAKVQEANQKLIDDEYALNEEYRNALSQRTSELTNFAGIFDEVSKASTVSGQQLIKNLQNQVDTFVKWSENITSLANKGIDEGLLEELRLMGPKAAGEIAALNTLTSKQLEEYSELWKTKNELARKEAINQLEGLRTDTDIKINELRDQTTLQLDQYKAEWAKKITEIRIGTKDEFVKLTDETPSIGVNAIKGLMDGMEDMRGPLMRLARDIADDIKDEIEDALDINSPSRELKETGGYTIEGLIVGMADKLKGVRETAKKVAVTAKESVNKFLDGFNIPQIDNEIRVKVVMDYENFDVNRLGIKPIVVAPDTSYANESMSVIRSANRQNGNNYPTNTDSNPKVITKDVKIDQHLVFNTRQMTPSEVARKNLQASRQIALQFGG